MENSPKKQGKQSNLPNGEGVFHLAKGMAVAATMTGYIIGPLIVLAGIGWWLDKKFDTYPFILIGSIFLAFIITNILILSKAAGVVKSYAIKKEDKNCEPSQETKVDGKE